MASRNETQQRKLELVAQLDTQRNAITGGRHIFKQQFTNRTQSLKDKLNIPKRIKTSVRTHQTKWILGALGTGLAIAFLKGRSKSSRAVSTAKKRTLVSAILLAVLRPMVKGWVVKQVTRIAANKVQQIQNNA